MNIVINGMDQPVEIKAGKPTALRVYNQALYARICRSFESGLGTEALEPYSIWDGETEVSPRDGTIVIGDPLDLPWDHRLLAQHLAERFIACLQEDEETRQTIDSQSQEIMKAIERIAFSFNSEYSFTKDWDLTKFIKLFGLEPEQDPGEPYIDSCIRFTEYIADMGFKGVIIFMNLGLFLTKSEFKTFLDTIIFLNLNVLLLEGASYIPPKGFGGNIAIDEDFVEGIKNETSQNGVPLQEGICTNGFGSVTF